MIIRLTTQIQRGSRTASQFTHPIQPHNTPMPVTYQNKYYGYYHVLLWYVLCMFCSCKARLVSSSYYNTKPSNLTHSTWHWLLSRLTVTRDFHSTIKIVVVIRNIVRLPLVLFRISDVLEGIDKLHVCSQNQGICCANRPQASWHETMLLHSDLRVRDHTHCVLILRNI